MPKVHSEILGHKFELSETPMRIVSLLSAATELIDWMGLHHRLVGVSEYCERYIDASNLPVVGRYMDCDVEAIENLKPDLILITSGIQNRMGIQLAVKHKLPIYALPLPHSFYGMLENMITVGSLLGELEKARSVVNSIRTKAEELRSHLAHGSARPKVYVELWLGRHMRAVGGMSFISDMIEIAGGELLYSNRCEGYFVPDFEEVKALSPDVYLFFHEPEYYITPKNLIEERGWEDSTEIIVSTVDRGFNVIQEGPSFIETAQWLQQQFIEATLISEC